MFNIDKRFFYIIIGIVVFRLIASMVSDTATMLGTLLMVPAVLIAITFHEFAHAYAAYKLGDNTAKEQGRLNLNPFSHIDIVGLIMLFTVGIGWGKPVQINVRNFKKEMSVTKAEAIVSIAGPLMNFFISVIVSIFYAFMVKYGWFQTLSSENYAYLLLGIYYIIMLNIGLGVFNLIPLPPLDGSKVLKSFMSARARIWFEGKQHIFYIVFVILWITGISSIIISPIIGWISEQLVNLINFIINL